MKNKVVIGVGITAIIIGVIIGGIKYMNYYTSRDWYQQALKYMEDDNESYAFAMCHNALIYDNEYIDALMLRAQICQENYEDYESAWSLTNEAMGYIDEPTAMMYYIKGRAAYHLNKPDQSLELLEIAESMQEFDSISYYRGLVYLHQKVDYVIAKEQFQLFNENFPSLLSTYQLGMTAFISEDYNEATKKLSYCLERNKINKEILFTLSDAYLNISDTTNYCKTLRVGLNKSFFYAYEIKNRLIYCK